MHTTTYLAKWVHALLDICQLNRALVDANFDGIINDTFDTDKDLHIVIYTIYAMVVWNTELAPWYDDSSISLLGSQCKTSATIVHETKSENFVVKQKSA